MALVRVAQYNSTPTVVTDYQAQNAHLQAFTNQLMTQQFILDSGTAQPVIKQGCYVSHGGSLYVADADTAITGSPADGSVYIRVSGTTSLTVEFVTDISGYAWNPVYSALTSGSYTLLPYLLIKASSVWGRYNFNANAQAFGDTRLNSLAVTGVISGASVDTGQGATEVHLMNQNIRTVDTPAFNDLLPSFNSTLIAGSVKSIYSNYGYITSPYNTWVTILNNVNKVIIAKNPYTACTSIRLVLSAYCALSAGESYPCRIRVYKNGIELYTSDTLTLNSTYTVVYTVDTAWSPDDIYRVDVFKTNPTPAYYVYGKIEFFVNRGYNVLEDLYN